MLSHEPCLGVWWISSFCDRRRAYLRLERLVEGGGGVGVEIVHHHDDPLGARVMNVYELLHATRPVGLRPPLGDADVSPTPQELGDDEEIGRPLALVLVVLATRATLPGGHGLSDVGQKPLALLVEAHPCGKRSS
jgi:hypothetical protein